MPESATLKQALRAQYAALRKSFPQDLRIEAEAAIRQALYALPAWSAAPLVCGYVPTRGEIDLRPVWGRAVAEGKAYGLPVTTTGAAEGRMIFRRLEAYTPADLRPARFGIPEPSEHCPALTLRDYEGALILVPGLAFDDQGFRIGYGGGYYDRFLAELTREGISVTTVGLAFSVCRPPRLIHEPHDVAVQYILDERRVIPSHGAP